MKPDLPRLSELPLKNGTKVIAVRNFGPVREGAPGIITGTSVYRFFWWWPPSLSSLKTGTGNVPTRTPISDLPLLSQPIQIICMRFSKYRGTGSAGGNTAAGSAVP